MIELAINGGPKVKTTTFGKGKRFGQEEKDQLMQVIDDDVLFYFFGKKGDCPCALFLYFSL